MRILIVLAALTLSMSGCSCQTVEPGNRAVLVDWGKPREAALGEGFHVGCVGCDFNVVSVRTQKEILKGDCFSSDLQEVNVNVAVLYRIPEAKVVEVFRQYHGQPFEVLIAPRAQESLKEATASRSAEHIVKDRETVKKEALESLRKKVGDILVVEDLIIVDINLSGQLTQAIEQKMVMEQEAAKAKFSKIKAEIDAETAIARAKGVADSTLLQAEADAKSIKIRGDALHQNPSVIELELIQKWNGVSPQIVSGGSNGLSLLLPAVGAK